MPEALRPTFSESWYRVKDLRARLRPTAQVSRQIHRSELWYVVRDPAGNQYHRLSESAYAFLGLLDGRRSVGEAWETVEGQLGDSAPTQNEVVQILSNLHGANLIEADVPPDAEVLLKRKKKQVRSEWKSRALNVLFPRIPLWDCDRFVTRWMKVFGLAFTPVGGLVWLAMIAFAGISLLPHSAELRRSAGDAIAPDNWLWLYVVFTGTKLLHEMGHAFSCRKFGAETHELGVMFLVFMPTPYIETSTSWMLAQKWKRITIGAAGMLVETFVAAIAALIWLNTTPGQLPHQLAYNAMLVAGVSTIVFNLNPLLRYDGYYMLSDWLEIPNLQKHANEYLVGLVKRHVYRVRLPGVLPPWSQRVWLFVYAVLSNIYRVFVGIMIMLVVSFQVPILGVLMALGGVMTWGVYPLARMLNYLLLSPELHRKRGMAMVWTLVMLGAVGVAVGGVTYRVHFETQGITEPDEHLKEAIRPREGGFVKTILVRDGQRVTRGQPLVELEDIELTSNLEKLQARARALNGQLDQATASDPAARKIVLEQLVPVEREAKKMQDRIADLVVRSPIDGIVISPRLMESRGRFIQQGKELGMVQQPGQLVVRALLEQSDAAMVYRSAARTAELRLSGDIARVFVGRLADRTPVTRMDLPHPSLGYAGGGAIQTDPGDREGLKTHQPMVEVVLHLDDAAAGTLPGQRALVRFDFGDHTLAWRAARRLWQLFESQGT